MLRRSTALTVSAFCALALGGAGAVAASATTTPAKGTLTACVNHVSGAFYNLTVGPAPDKSCARGDVRVRWNQAGIQGRTGAAGADGRDGAAGQQGAKGDKGDTGARGAAGVDGQDGAAGPNGKDGAGFLFRAAWDGETTYALGDVVSLNGSSYIALVSDNTGKSPDANPLSWAMLAQKGAQGEPGADGQPGLDGMDGSDGMDGAKGDTGPSVASTAVNKKVDVNLAESAITTADVKCASGIAISGGWESTTTTVKASYPSVTDPDTWRFVFYNPGVAGTVSVHVLCIS